MPSFNELLIKLILAALLLFLATGAGFYLGFHVKKTEMEALQAQLANYKNLGDRMKDLNTRIENDMRKENRALVDSYTKEIERIRDEFDNAQKSLTKATDELKKRGASVNSSAQSLVEAIEKLPQSPEREAKIAEFIALMSDPQKRQALCTTTPVAPSQLTELTPYFKRGAP